MKTLRTIAALSAFLVFPLTAPAQVEAIVTVPVSGNLHMLEGSGGNVAVSAGGDGILIVDSKFEADEPRIRESLKAIDPGPLKFLLNTHFHGDHSGGNAGFGKEAVIIAHENVRGRLSAEGPKSALPVVTFEDRISVHFNGEEIELVHLPAGHTDTDSVVYFRESNVVHMGDLFFSGRFPYIDLKSGGTVQGYLDNVGKVLETLPDDAKVIPGHGPLSTKEDLKRFHTMIAECYASVKEQVEAGKSIQEIQEQGVPSAWKDWGWRFISEERWLIILHEDAVR